MTQPLHRTEPQPGWLATRRPFVRLLAEAAAQLGGRLEMEAAFGHLGRYTAPDGRARTILGNALGVNPDAAAALAADKDYTARLLRAEGLPAPDGLLLFAPAYRAAMALKNAAVAAALPEPEAALDFAGAIGWPVIVKPNGGSEGRGVSRVADAAELRADVERLFATDQKVRVEACCPGADHRLVVWDGAVRIAYRRTVASLTGDGVHSVAALLGALRTRLARTARGAKLDPADPRIARALAEAGLGMASVPATGQRIPLLPNANLSTGGTCEDLTGLLPAPVQALAVRAAQATGLRLAGVDILAPDLIAGPQGATVIEVNAAPGLDGYAASGREPWSRSRALIAEVLSA